MGDFWVIHLLITRVNFVQFSRFFSLEYLRSKYLLRLYVYYDMGASLKIIRDLDKKDSLT